MSHRKWQPKIITYGSNKYFNNDSFGEQQLRIEDIGNNSNENSKNFTSSSNVILNKHAYQKKNLCNGKSTIVNE